MLEEHIEARFTGTFEGEEMLFMAEEGGPLRIGNWRCRTFDKACAKAGIVGATPHSLRHTFVQLARSYGMQDAEIAFIGGWKDSRTLATVYTHPVSALMEIADERIAKAMEEARSEPVGEVKVLRG